MGRYRYKAIGHDGEIRQGEIEAENELAAARRLQQDGLMPLSARPARLPLFRHFAQSSPMRKRQPGHHLVQELGTLLEAGVPIDQALRLMANLAKDPEQAKLVEALHRGIGQGLPLSAAMAAQNGEFTPLQISLIRAGEATGELAPALARLGRQLERARELKENLRSALVYPSLLLLVSSFSVVGLLLFVVPRFAQMFQEMGQTLPSSTRLVVAAGDFLQHWGGLLLLLALVLAAWLQKRLADPRQRRRWHDRLLRLPLLGELLSRMDTARFTRTLALLINSGIDLPQALRLSTDVVENLALRQRLQQALPALESGHGLGALLATSNALPALAVEMIKVGEAAGQLVPMLDKVADEYEARVSGSIRRLLAMLEPVLVIGLGLMVAGIIASILIAVLDANQLLL